MDLLHKQFLAEARELVESASRCLLALEERPDDADPLQALFRALHTLKGTSGIFAPEFDPLTRVAHAGEDLLDAVRQGRIPFTGQLADRLLTSLDQIGLWLNGIAQGQGFPPDSESQSLLIVDQLRERPAADEPASPPVGRRSPAVATLDPITSWPWLAEILPSEWMTLRSVGGDPGSRVQAIWFKPDPNCLVAGDDPLYLMSRTPALLGLWVDPPEAWSVLAFANEDADRDAIDPLQCHLVFRALSGASVATLREHFRSVARQVDFQDVPIPPSPAAESTSPPDPDAEAIAESLREQLFAQDLPHELASWSSRQDGGAANRGGHLDRSAFTAALAQAREQSGRQRSFKPLHQLFDTWLAASAPVSAPTPVVSQPLAVPATAPPAPPRPTSATVSSGKLLKIEQGRIDTLMDLTGELVVAKNSIPFLAKRADAEFQAHDLAKEIDNYYHHVNRLVESLQTSVMQIRMLPVGEIFQRFPRLVRDVSRKLGKQIRLTTSGDETQADKNIIELLAEPLIHLVRNSLDHGLGTPLERELAGKPREGEIRLSASQESDRLIIEVVDDGRGIDPQRIKAKALEQGLLDEATLATMGDQEAIQLIFAQGFSTSGQVSDLSGRGVGMDVVRSAIRQVGGEVALFSQYGTGTRVRLELPMSMAIIQVMVVEEGGTLYGIPLEQVLETLKLPADRILWVKDRETIVLRDRVLPLLRLQALLGLPEPVSPPEEVTILIVRVAGHPMGLVVASLQKGLDIVLKPLEGILAGLPGFSGAALLGDGRILLVLNLRELL